MRQIEGAKTEELLHAVHACRSVLLCEVAGQWGVTPVGNIDLERCLRIVEAYEARASVVSTDIRRLIADIKEGRKRGV